MNIRLAALLVSSLTFAACGNGGGTTVVDSSMPTDAAADAATDTSTPTDTGAAACFTQESAAAVCPSAAVAQANAMAPTFRVTHIKITAPAALASPILGNVVNGAVHSGGFLWGISFDLAGNMLRTGALNTAMLTRGTVGQGLLDGTFRYFAGNAPAAGGAPTRWDPVTTTLTTTAGRVTSGTLMGTVRLPIYGTDGSLLTELPLENARMSNVLLPMDGKCIGLGAVSGGRFNECSSNWVTADGMTPYGTLSAVITVAAARQVRVESLNTTLCNLLAGSNCETTPQAMWTRQPDAMAGTEPGYNLATEFSAVSARIQ